MTNVDVLQRMGLPKKVLRGKILYQKLSYFGHVCRHEGLDKDIMLGMVEGKRKRGRPALQWTEDVVRLCGSITDAVRAAQDRASWRRTSRVAAASVG